MSRRTQLTTKFFFQITAQLSENFIFIYLGLSLITETGLEYKPLFILVATAGICVARYCAVFPLSSVINWLIRRRATVAGRPDMAEEIPRNHQIMIYWAGLRGAVGVALAARLKGKQSYALKATVLVVVVLTVIIFGGTTARMLEILEIRTGVVDETDSDDEFDIETVPHYNGAPKRNDDAPRLSSADINLSNVRAGQYKKSRHVGSYSTGNINGSPTDIGSGSNANTKFGRRNSSRNIQQDRERTGLLLDRDDSLGTSEFEDLDDEIDDTGLDLPPAAKRQTTHFLSPNHADQNATTTGGTAANLPVAGDGVTDGILHPALVSARGAINQLLNTAGKDAATMFNRLDESFIKPHLLLDPGGTTKHHSNRGGAGV